MFRVARVGTGESVPPKRKGKGMNMAERIPIKQGIEHYVTVKESSLPSLADGAYWMMVLFNRAANRRFIATRMVESGVAKYTWEAGASFDATTGTVTIDNAAVHSTAHMPEGIYDLELVASDLSRGGGTSRGRYEVVKSSVMANNPNS